MSCSFTAAVPLLLSATPHPPLDLHRGHVTFPTRLCVCVCVLTRKIEGEGGTSLPYKGFTDAFMLENEASGKSYNLFIYLYIYFLPHSCDCAVCLWFVLLLVFLKTSVLCGNTLMHSRCSFQCWESIDSVVVMVRPAGR